MKVSCALEHGAKAVRNGQRRRKAFEGVVNPICRDGVCRAIPPVYGIVHPMAYPKTVPKKHLAKARNGGSKENGAAVATPICCLQNVRATEGGMRFFARHTGAASRESPGHSPDPGVPVQKHWRSGCRLARSLCPLNQRGRMSGSPESVSVVLLF